MTDPIEPTTWSFYRPHDREATWVTGELVNPKTGEVYTPPSMTKQEFAQECDINNIIKAFKVTGQVTHINAQRASGTYQDLPDPLDFQESLNAVRQANEAFNSLPSKVRERFNNDPQAFLTFMANPANQDEMIKLGLATRTPQAAPPAPPAPPAAPAPPPPSPAPPA